MKATGNLAKQAYTYSSHFGKGVGLRGSVQQAANCHRRCFATPTGIQRQRGQTNAALLLVEGGAPAAAEIGLQDSDFPKEYISMAHPDDYIISTSPIEPTLIDFKGRRFGHNGLILRVSFELVENSRSYVPMSFVVHSGAPFHFYMNDTAFDILHEGGRLPKDGNDQDYLKVFSKNALVHETPTTHRPANLLGLLMIKYLHGISVGGGDNSVPDDGHFVFGKSFSHF